MKTFIVDSFTSQPFKGNPAGVCFPAQALPEAQMQSIAMELGLSETAFVLPAKESGHYSIRYFSPKKEIPLCGHATLASASILFRNAGIQRIHFITVEGVDLTVERRDDAVAMFFPLYDTSPAEAPAPLLAALGITTVMDTRWSEK
ncbi:MAG TPA: PhzF family phenazine biosynthesis isomerase, partial [Chitinophagaceae bacterium]|nr:PhzF family phenazine biosynthesis isomerase [Chitinophagaceae bacterium]